MSQVLLQRLPVTLFGEHILIEDGKPDRYIFSDKKIADEFQYNTNRRLVLDAIIAVRNKCEQGTVRLIGLVSGPVNAWDWHKGQISDDKLILQLSKDDLLEHLETQITFSLHSLKRLCKHSRIGVIEHALLTIREFIKLYRA